MLNNHNHSPVLATGSTAVFRIKYAHITFLLGVGFESLPVFSWAHDILDDAEYIPAERLSMLEEEAIARITSLPYQHAETESHDPAGQ